MTGVELLHAQIALLVADRQQLRAAGASRESLEENRLELLRSQSELSRALIEQHLPSRAA